MVNIPLFTTGFSTILGGRLGHHLTAAEALSSEDMNEMQLRQLRPEASDFVGLQKLMIFVDIICFI